MNSLKIQAKRLKSTLSAQHSVELPLNACQHVVAVLHGFPNWQTALAVEPSLQPACATDSLVGRFFHSVTQEGVGWQGTVMSQSAPGVYLVQLFDWLSGAPSDQKLVNRADMVDWLFYSNNQEMLDSYESGKADEHCKSKRLSRSRSVKQSAQVLAKKQSEGNPFGAPLDIGMMLRNLPPPLSEEEKARLSWD